MHKVQKYDHKLNDPKCPENKEKDEKKKQKNIKETV